MADDCFWDFVACKRENSIGSSTIFRKGRMINRRNQNGRDQSCCQNRYHKCCEHVTGWTDQKDPTPTVPTTPRPTPTRPVTPRSICPKTTPSNLSKSKSLFNTNFLYLRTFRRIIIKLVYFYNWLRNVVNFKQLQILFLVIDFFAYAYWEFMTKVNKITLNMISDQGWYIEMHIWNIFIWLTFTNTKSITILTCAI